MTTIGLPSRYSSDIATTRNSSFGGPILFGCNAFTDDYPQRAKSFRNSTQHISSRSGSSAVLSISANLTNNDHPEETRGNMKPAVVKQESLKHAHGEVQSQFANMMAIALDNQHGNELQCCITYSKPCGCIRKYILGGDKWKENSALQLRNADEIDPQQVIENDKTNLGRMEMDRARELVNIYEHAAELKKEKCYAFNNVEVEGKSLKELRGMIGLGNGRKRSKKYEDYVLQMRSKLRNQYALCEKAAQKLLGYSINFLYKKLRTNPQKTSRLVATNKAERASKAPRHLIPLEELREMGRKPNGTNQCCGRNCISRLASQHFDKIEDWRKRLEGSGQRVAQEIVAEVLRASSSSLDGQSSFCQNLVHWVTGCSFKKIRRVRDHLKKDPASLPEHGLKKYWKDKVKNKQKNEPAQKIPKTEKQDYTDPEMMHMDSGMYYYQNQLSGIQMQQQNFSLPYATIPDSAYNSTSGPTRPTPFTNSDTRDSTGSTQWPGTNLNNSNNMLMPARAYGDNSRENKPIIGLMQTGLHDRGTPDVNQVTNSGQFQNHATQNHATPGSYLPPDDQQFRMQQRRLLDSRQMTASPYQQPPDASMTMQSNQSYGQQPQQQQYSHVMKNQIAEDAGLQHHQGQAAARSSVILHTAGSQLQPSHQKQPPPYGQTTTAGGNIEDRNDAYHSNQLNNAGQNEMLSMAFNSHQMYGQHYYIAAANNSQESANFFPGGVTQGLAPFVLSSGETENADDMKNGEYKQPFYILSPIPHGDKGFSATDLKSFQQLPLTPIQILQTPYLPSGKGFEQNGEGRQESQQFFFPMSVTNAEAFQGGEYDKADGGQDLKNGNQNAAMQFPHGTALKSLAVVHGGNGFFNLGPWQMPNQVDPSGGTMHSQQPGARSDSGQQWPVLALQQYPPNVNLDQVQNQPQIMYDASQFQSHQSQYTGGQMPANDEPWRKEESEKKNVHAADPVSKHPHGAPTSVAYQQNPMYEQDQRHSDKVSETKDNPEEEKDGGGIVTPNIIREALSNNFGAMVAGSGGAGSLTSVPVPELAPIPNKQGVETKVPPPLEMPKLDPIDSKDSEQGDDQTAKGDEERCAPINTRLKRFSRDRLRATIDSPNIVLTPYTPLTPSLTPAITIPDTSGDETAKENSASSTNSQNKGGDIFRFPPTHVSRRAAAIRLQGQTVSDAKICKAKSPKDSPRTPGPFPVAAGSSPNPDNGEQTESTEADNAGTSMVDKTKSPALTLRGLNQSSDADKLTKDKIPVIGFDAANWQDVSTLPSPGMEPTDDTALNTPTQQPLNTPTSLNTPTQQLNTPNQDLKTPTESPVKSLHTAPGKRKLESPSDSSGQTDDPTSSQSNAKSSGPAAKSLRFHCFTPKDFNDGVNCSAFRKPSEFASTPTDSAIAQRRRKPRKQPHPSSLSTPEDENGHEIDMREITSPESKDNEDSTGDAVMTADNTVNESAGPREQRSQISAKAGFPGLPRLGDGGVMLLGNPYDSQTPSFLQLITPSLFPASGSIQDPSGRQQTPFSTQQVNTPVFLHSATFLTPGGSGMLRKISPAAIQSGTSNTPQVFTFMPGGLPTPSKPLRTQDTDKKVEDEQNAENADSSKASAEDVNSKTKIPEKEAKPSSKVKQKPSTLPLSDIPPSPALTGKDSGLQTPSNLKVVTPSLAMNSVGSVPASEQQQIFNFPSSGLPGLYPVTGPAARSAPRGSYVLCTPSKTSPTGSILYHPCTSPSKTKGPVALVPIEMVSTPQKTTNQVHSTSTLNESASKEHDKPAEKLADKDNSGVPVIVVDSPTKGADDKTGDSKKSIETKHSSDNTKPSESPNKVAATSPEKKPVSSNVKNPTAKSKSSSSPKGLPKPLVMSHVNIENPNVQTPTMIHLVSPSHHSPNSPLVLYPMTRPPLAHGQPGSKIQSPLSANSASGTPQLMVLQRFYGPGSSSSLLKSALMKSMPVFQFPPPVPTTSTGSSVSSQGDETVNSSEVSSSPCSVSSSGEVMDTSPSAAVSVICGPRASGQRPPEQLANDPCLSESAQQ